MRFNKATKVLLAYCTFPTTDVAESISEQLLAEGLIACANIQQPHVAIYHWQGHLKKESECVAWFKLSVNKKVALMERIRALHPYTTPALIFLEPCDGLPEFLNWVYTETL
jgi:periplasmic divalent cation tolerance protein